MPSHSQDHTTSETIVKSRIVTCFARHIAHEKGGAKDRQVRSTFSAKAQGDLGFAYPRRVRCGLRVAEFRVQDFWREICFLAGLDRSHAFREGPKGAI